MRQLRQVNKGRRDGFTLIELLVVIAIISLLMAILLPGLGRAREYGKRAVCLHNLGQIMVAWNMYADDNGDNIVNVHVWKVHCDWPCPMGSTPGGAAYAPGSDGDRLYRGQVGWVEFPHEWNTATAPTSGAKGPPHNYCPGIPLATADERDWQHSIACGGLWRYIRDYKLYRCPIGEKDAYVTYASVITMNGHYGSMYCAPAQSYPYRNRLQIKNTAERLVFIDQGSNDAVCSNWEVRNVPLPNGWWDAPPMRHGKGTTLAFADAHCEYRKWREGCTISLTGSGPPTISPDCVSQNCNQDLMYMQKIICGQLGYAPGPDCTPDF